MRWRKEEKNWPRTSGHVRQQIKLIWDSNVSPSPSFNSHHHLCYFQLHDEISKLLLNCNHFSWKLIRKFQKEFFPISSFQISVKKSPQKMSSPCSSESSPKTAWVFSVCASHLIWSSGFAVVKLIPVVDTLTSLQSQCSNELGRREEDSEGFLFVLPLNNTARWQPANKSICVARSDSRDRM